MELLKLQEEYSEDELDLGREAFKLLYHEANRDIPDYFPNRPAEEVHDPARVRWQYLLNHYEQAKLRRTRKETYIGWVCPGRNLVGVAWRRLHTCEPR